MDINLITDKQIIDGAESGYDLVIRHPVTDEETDIVVTVLGTEGTTFKKVVQDKVKDKSNDDDGSNFLARMTKGWENLEIDGELVEFSEEKAEDVYRSTQWLAKQVERAIANKKLFF